MLERFCKNLQQHTTLCTHLVVRRSIWQNTDSGAHLMGLIIDQKRARKLITVIASLATLKLNRLVVLAAQKADTQRGKFETQISHLKGWQFRQIVS